MYGSVRQQLHTYVQLNYTGDTM